MNVLEPSKNVTFTIFLFTEILFLFFLTILWPERTDQLCLGLLHKWRIVGLRQWYAVGNICEVNSPRYIRVVLPQCVTRKNSPGLVTTLHLLPLVATQVRACPHYNNRHYTKSLKHCDQRCERFHIVTTGISCITKFIYLYGNYRSWAWSVIPKSLLQLIPNIFRWFPNYIPTITNDKR